MISQKLSVIIPCYNQEKTLETCVKKLIAALDGFIQVEIIIVDDGSTDQSVKIAKKLRITYPFINLEQHNNHQGKGVVLRSGFQKATGDFLTIQDADLAYDPQDLRKLILPLTEERADIVFGSRFLPMPERRVIYFWPTISSKLLTFMSNLFSNLTLTDFETSCKVFRREIIQNICLKENGSSIDAEIIAKIAHQNYRIYEIGITYEMRTKSEDKKSRWQERLRTVYAILHYNVPHLPLPLQIIMYLFIGGISAIFNILLFAILLHYGLSIFFATLNALLASTIFNYVLCINFLFEHEARWKSQHEFTAYLILSIIMGAVDLALTNTLSLFYNPIIAKIMSICCIFVFNFMGRKLIIFRKNKSKSLANQIKEA